MSHTFRVDLRGIIDLLSHHLYSSPRVYVRELLQNAVDAITARRELDPSCPAEVTITCGARLRITDTGVGVDRTGQLQHTGPDRIFRIDWSGKSSIALETDSLQGPNGITWDSAGHRFVVVPFFGSTPLAWAPGDRAPQRIGTGPGQEDGVEEIEPGRYLVTSWADSSLFALADGHATRVASALPSPADIGWDPGRRHVAVPLLLQDRVEIWEVP